MNLFLRCRYPKRLHNILSELDGLNYVWKGKNGNVKCMDCLSNKTVVTVFSNNTINGHSGI